jgi:hypothetical protein
MAFAALAPGRLCASETASRNSSSVSQLRCWTTIVLYLRNYRQFRHQNRSSCKQQKCSGERTPVDARRLRRELIRYPETKRL